MLRINVNVHDPGGPHDLPLDLRDVLTDVAADWTREIRDRTRAGRDATGRQMRPRADGSPATLTDTGRTLASLQPDVHEGGFRLLPRISPCANRSAIQAASLRSLLRPGTFRICWALASTRVNDSSRTCHTGFQYTPVASIARGVDRRSRDNRTRSTSTQLPATVPYAMGPRLVGARAERHALEDGKGPAREHWRPHDNPGDEDDPGGTDEGRIGSSDEGWNRPVA